MKETYHESRIAENPIFMPGAIVVTKIDRFNYALIYMLAHNNELLHRNQMVLFLRV